MDDLRFTIPEILSLIGVTQCVYLLVYIMFRAGKLSRAGLPLLYFSVLGLAFLYDFAHVYVGNTVPYYSHIRWFAWFSGPPISVLLVMQIAQITKVPDLRHYWVLLIMPVAFGISALMSGGQNMQEWLVISGLIGGAISLLAIWSKSGLFDSILQQRTGKERYWLILTLISMNILFLVTMLASLGSFISQENIVLVRTVLGLGFIYLVSTSLFRIYPRAIQLSSAVDGNNLTSGEKDLAQKIEKLLKLDKVYHEPTYSRADLARECNASESVVSRVINLHFGKSFPQLMNEHRIEDAKRLLKETAEPVRTVCKEVGFNSLPSFNRVFKDMTGHAPSEYRNIRKG